jgi:hypothetical protein
VTRRIAIIVEGATESAFKKSLDNFLTSRLAARRKPKLRFISEDGRIPIGDRLRRDVERLLKKDHDDVVALTDVYTGSKPPEFINAADAKAKMRQWVGPEPRFHPHAAQYEFEAWLFPFWSQIQSLSGSNRQCPSQTPEIVNHDKPPAAHLNEVFRTGKKRRTYSKIRDGMAILRGQDIALSASACPELKAFLNTILGLSGGKTL